MPKQSLDFVIAFVIWK